MPTITKSELILPKELTALQREPLADNPYRVHCQIFDGVDPASFRKYVVESKADQTAVQVYQERLRTGACDEHAKADVIDLLQSQLELACALAGATAHRQR